MLKWLVVEGMSSFQLSDESKKSKFIWLPVNLRWFYPLGGKRVFVLQSQNRQQHHKFLKQLNVFSVKTILRKT